MLKTKKADVLRHIKLTLEYDGSGFFGFQKQPGGVLTVQSAVEEALERLFQKKTPLISASSRTDAGVHAECQVTHFKAQTVLSPFRLALAVNHFLPETISVLKAEDVPDDFHARFQPRSKIYEYRIWNDECRPAIYRNLVYHEPFPLNLSAMKKAARLLEGKHDFRAFTSEDRIAKGRAPSKKISFVRTVKAITVQKRGKMILIKVEADGFLYRMARNIAGTLNAVGKGKLKPEDVTRVLKSRDRKQAAATLPAQGLTLKKVIY